MEENNKNTIEVLADEAQQSKQKPLIDTAAIYTALVLNWKWFMLSIIICVGMAAIYLRYTTPIYRASEKILIKNNDNNSRNRSIMSSSTLGMISNTDGIDNEMEILTSHSLAAQTVSDLKLYVNYYSVGKVKDILLYKTQPISVDMDTDHLEKLRSPINLLIERQGRKYHITGTYFVSRSENQLEGPFAIDKTIPSLPSTIATRAGVLKLTPNSPDPMSNGQQMKVIIQSPVIASNKYVGEVVVGLTSKTTTIVRIVMNDESPQRAIDYLRQLAVCYNRQANEDKNEIAARTEDFINGRLEKINAELGNTEGQLENYKKRNGMVELKMNAGQAFGNADSYQQKLNEANTQIALLDELSSFINNPNNKYQPLPVNIGISNETASSLISNYNTIVQKRNLLLQSASETSPAVIPLTTQLDQLMSAIQRAITQARRSMDIQRSSVASEYGRYQGQVGETPEQERILTQIGRQQEVKSGLYLMLLQKREENSISLAATADKGKLIDGPSFNGKVSPNGKLVMLIGLLLGIAIPALFIYVSRFFHYKIESHDEVAKLTKLPILADVAVASDVAKTKADIVVHENKNNVMEEIFRSMRTNLQFMLEEGQKVVLCTSTTSGEGKTFTASNLAMSFALLGKSVLLVGLDIRKPRLAHLFGIDDESHGITNLLMKESPTWEQIESQILPSGINNHLCILPAGPIPPNPAELVARQSLDDIFKTLRENFDYIIVDSAPAGIVTDTLAIARTCDMTIYMCRADYTPKESIDLINEFAKEHKLPKVSIVLNGIDLSKKKYGYYYGYGRYGKYGKYGRNRNGYGYYSHYGSYSTYSNSHYGDKNDKSIKR